MLNKLVLMSMFLCLPTAQANVTGSDLQNFNATSNGLDFVTVHSSETLIPGIFNIGLFSNYAVNTLPRFSDENIDSEGIADSILAADLNLGLGLARGLDIGISFPFMVAQTVNTEGARGEFNAEGLTEVRANIKYRLFGDSTGGIATIFSVNQNLTENNPFSGDGGGPILNFELAFDTQILSINAGLNVGYRLRSPGTAIPSYPIEPLKDQIIASAALSKLFTSIDTKVIVEAITAAPVADSSTVEGRSVSASEALLGLKYDITRNLALHVGASTEIGNGTSSPDWRVYSGLNLVNGMYKSKAIRAKKRRKRKKASPAPEPELPPILAAAVEEGPKEQAGEGDLVFALRDVNFAFDSDYEVVAGAQDLLKELASHLNRRGYTKVTIEGHTDSVGAIAYNKDLGKRRANTIAKYLATVEKMDFKRIWVVSYGEERPIADNGNYQGRQLNRRVVFRITY